MKNSKGTKQSAEKNTRAIFDTPVQRQGSPIFKVLSMGTCVEFTDRIGSAESAYKGAAKPKEMWRIAGRQCDLMRKEVI